MKISVDKARCTGHARCFDVAEAVYTLDESGFNASDGAVVSPGLEDLARSGAESCPERAITLAR